MCGQGAGSYARWSARLCLPTVIFLIHPYTCASQTCAPRACLIERELNQLYWLRQPRHDSVEIYHAVIVNTVTFYLGTPAPLMEMGGWTAFHVIRKTWYGNDLRASLEPGLGVFERQQCAATAQRGDAAASCLLNLSGDLIYGAKVATLNTRRLSSIIAYFLDLFSPFRQPPLRSTCKDN